MRKHRNFVENNLATDISILLEQGIPLVEKQADLTPFQRQVLVEQYIREQEEKQEQIDEQLEDNGSGMNKMSGGTVNSRNSRIQAIKESQEEEEHYYNKSLVNNGDN